MSIFCMVIIASIAATSEDGLEAAAEIARTEIVPEISAIEGVSRADITGGLETRLLVTLDPALLAESGVSVNQITGILTANNLTVPSGQVADGGTRIPVSTIGRLTSVESRKNGKAVLARDGLLQLWLRRHKDTRYGC